MTVNGNVAFTHLKQSFRNPSNELIPEAQHTFPLYDGAVVTSFECTIGETRYLRGVVKPKQQARHEFEQARKQKREAAALLEELTPEIFETSLGNIPANTTVHIQLTYVHELKAVTMEDEMTEGLAMTIPLSIAPRYGHSDTPPMAPKLKGDKLEIWVRVIDDGSVNPDGCHVESGHYASFVGSEPVKRKEVGSIADLASLASPTVARPRTQFV